VSNAFLLHNDVTFVPEIKSARLDQSFPGQIHLETVFMRLVEDQVLDAPSQVKRGLSREGVDWLFL
jgi:hypothetical protein